MKMYHGTSFENAMKILTEGFFKGNRKLAHHKHAYISFTSTFNIATDFGEIVFHTDYDASLFTQVEYDNAKWLRKNQEIVEYVGVWYDCKKETKKELLAIQFEQEYVVKDRYPWKGIVNAITIYANENENVEEMYKQLEEAVKGTVPIEIKQRWKKAQPSKFEVEQWSEFIRMVEELDVENLVATIQKKVG